MELRIFLILGIGFNFLFLAMGCGIGSNLIVNNGICEGYGEDTTSDYILPFLQGETYQVSQSNCQGITHYGRLRYSYDFDMPQGTDIIAIRDGIVHKVLRESDSICLGNFVMVDHGDGTYARYLHLTSINVTEGASISQGDDIGSSGATGCTGGFPHLHLDVSNNSNPDIVETLPINFSNAGSNPRGLKNQTTYTAE